MGLRAQTSDPLIHVDEADGLELLLPRRRFLVLWASALPSSAAAAARLFCSARLIYGIDTYGTLSKMSKITNFGNRHASKCPSVLWSHFDPRMKQQTTTPPWNGKKSPQLCWAQHTNSSKKRETKKTKNKKGFAQKQKTIPLVCCPPTAS